MKGVFLTAIIFLVVLALYFKFAHKKVTGESFGYDNGYGYEEGYGYEGE